MSKETEEFHVSLKGFNITPEIAKRIEIEIRQVVLKELASMDLKGDIVVGNTQQQEDLTARIGTTRGIVAAVE